MPARAEASDVACGYTQLDDKGRVSLAKPIRDALGLGKGSVLAYVKIGDAVLLIPQDAHLAALMDAAAQVLEDAHIGVNDLMNALPQARDEMVAEHYGADFMDALERAGRSVPVDQPTGAPAQ